MFNCVQKIGAKVHAFCDGDSHSSLRHYFATTLFSTTTNPKAIACKKRQDLETSIQRMIKRNYLISEVKEHVLDICTKFMGLDLPIVQRILSEYKLADVDESKDDLYTFPSDIPRGPLEGS